jgi:hypothetical protein
MSYQLLSLVQLVAKKAHPCIWCREKILAGETHRREASVFCGDFQSHRWHPECYTAAQDAFRRDPDNCEFEPHDFKRGTSEEA